MKRSILVTVAALALVVSRSAKADFTLGFTDCPAGVTGQPGEVMTVHIFATLTSANLPPVQNPTPVPAGCPETSAIGPQGWSFGVQTDGVDSATIDLATVTVSTIFDNDAKCATPPIDDPLQLDNAGFPAYDNSDVTHDPADSTIKGVNAAVVLSIKKQTRYLHPTGTEKIADIAVTFTIPTDGSSKTIKLKFRDGLVGSGEPVPTVVTFNGKSNSLEKGEVQVQECSFTARAVGQTFNLALVEANHPTPAASGDTIYEATVAPGTPSTVTVLALLTTDKLPPIPVDNPPAGCPAENAVGPQGWSFGVGHDKTCMQVDGDNTTFQGVQVPTLYDDDAKCTTPAKDALFDLGDSGFPSLDSDPAVVNLPGAGNENVGGVAAAIVLSIKKQTRFLHPNTTDPLLKIVYHFPAVADGETKECRAYFLDGLVGSGEPVPTVVTFNGKSKSLEKGEVTAQGLKIRITGGIVGPHVAKFIRGDANDDGRVDIADVVYTVYSVVPTLDPTNLYTIKCLDAGDANNDNLVDLVDAVYTIDWQFRASNKPPVAPYPACGSDGDQTESGCPVGSTSCP